MHADDIQLYLEFDPVVSNETERALFKLSKCITDSFLDDCSFI